MSEITSTLEALRDGKVTTDDAVAEISAKAWPVRQAHQPAVAQGDDLAADVARGSFAEVAEAFAAGWISDAQYMTLAEAYGAALNQAAVPGPSIPDTDAATDADGDHDGDTFDWRKVSGPDWDEDLFDTGEAKGLPPLGTGAFVKTPDGGRGRIKTVDGGDATVTVWAKGDSGWKATGKTVTVPLAKLTRVPPLTGMGEAKDVEQAEHEVYRRGVQAWTPECKATPHSWATGRVEAFRLRAAGETVPGYVRDDDLL